MIAAYFGGRANSLSAAESARFFDRTGSTATYLRKLAGPAGADIIDLHVLIDPDMAWPKAIERSARSAIVLVGDDPGDPKGLGGAGAWRCTKRVSYWRRSALIHAAAATDEHYEIAVRMAMETGRTALIETTMANCQAWAEWLACPRTLVVVARGGVHPVPGAEVTQ